MDRAAPVEQRTAADLAREFGCTQTYIRALAHKHGAVLQSRRPMLIDAAVIRAAFSRSVTAEKIGLALWNTLKRDAKCGMPAHRWLKITERQAATLLVLAYDHLHFELTGKDPADPFPDTMLQMLTTAGV